MTLELDAASKRLLKNHLLHRGLNNRIAKRFGVDPSYVSKVACGHRANVEIMEEILRELRAIQNSK
jgi:transcriptional regulator with XRE-family HTH domain